SGLMGRRSRGENLVSEATDPEPASGVMTIAHRKGATTNLCPEARTKLIGDLCSLIRDGHMPDEMREAGLTLIGFLARRMPGEPADAIGVREARRVRKR